MASHWRRRDRTTSTGCVRWPTHLTSYGANGTSVYAVWPDPADNPLIVCAEGLQLHVTMREEPVNGSDEPWARLFPDQEDHTNEYRDQSVPLLGCLLLGTSGGSWSLLTAAEWEHGDAVDKPFWRATIEDLTEEGRAAVEAMNAVYGVDAIIATFPDT